MPEEVDVPRRERRPGRDRKAVFANVKTQKTAIVNAMEGGDIGRVHDYVSDLVEYNLSHGGAGYASKSLCDLAMKAKSLGLTALQVQLNQKSVEVNPADGWAWAQLGDALLANGSPHAALEAFANATSFGQAATGTSGRAEVMRSLGRLGEALQAYEDVVERVPDDVFARNGRAETLRELGRLEQALQTYEDVIERFPNDVVARTGRAETLRELGRLEQALQAYEDVIGRFPNDVFARTGRAETLRELGRLEQALQAYEDVVERFPNNVVARNGRAETLRELGRLEQAL
jgi:tetratricopeptide (TPR) repeat protein